jgi:hypothetical protein
VSATGDDVAAGFIAVSDRDFDRMRFELLVFNCRSCGERHVWSKSEALARVDDGCGSTS